MWTTETQPIWRRVVRHTAKRIVNWRFRGFDPGTHCARNVIVNDLRLTVAQGVFDPSLHFTSGFMSRYISKPAVLKSNDKVLDVGTGTGVLAIAAARAGCKQVVAVDLNPTAVACAKRNAAKHGLTDKVKVQQAEFVPVQTLTKFDHIICNPPYFRGTAIDDAQRAYLAGANLEWFDGFIRSVSPIVAHHGRVLLVLSDTADIGAILQRFRSAGWKYRVVARRDILLEIMYIFALAPDQVMDRHCCIQASRQANLGSGMC